MQQRDDVTRTSAGWRRSSPTAHGETSQLLPLQRCQRIGRILISRILNSNARHSYDRAGADKCLEAIPHHPDVRILLCADPTAGQRQTAG